MEIKKIELFNNSERIIDGIKPKKSKLVEEVHARKLLKMYARELITTSNTDVSKGEMLKLKEQIAKLKSDNESLKLEIESSNIKLEKQIAEIEELLKDSELKSQKIEIILEENEKLKTEHNIIVKESRDLQEVIENSKKGKKSR